MSDKKNDRIYKLYHYISKLNYLIWLLEANVLFMINNLPFLFVIIMVPLKLNNIPFFIITSLTILPSLNCLTKTLVQLRAGDEKVVKNYWKNFKNSFWYFLKKSLPFFLLTWVVISNLVIVNNVMNSHSLYWFNFILLYLLLVFLLNYLLVQATWDQSIKDAAILTAKLSVVRSFRIQLGAMIAIGSFFLFKFVPVYLIFYGVAVTIFLCLLNFQPVVEFVEDRKENQDI
ncbi:MAG TPA: hypothetical protein H9829_01570 [Candidatus Tetragenococcus pullicola]|nr:hypothetical protein [Candidatus Tetragenococcus pullicola]